MAKPGKRGGSVRVQVMRYRLGEIGGEAGKRIDELDAKSETRGLSADEMAEYNGLMRQHTGAEVFEFPDLTSLGVTDPVSVLERMRFIEVEAEKAYQSMYFLEAVSLRMLVLDFYLRAYIVSRTEEPIEPYSKQDKMTFRPLVEKARKHGLPDDLAGRLVAFNERRVSGIHHYLLGRGSYQEIGDAYRDADLLDEEILEAMVRPNTE